MGCLPDAHDFKGMGIVLDRDIDFDKGVEIIKGNIARFVCINCGEYKEVKVE